VAVGTVNNPLVERIGIRILTAIASVAVGTVNNKQHGADVINGKSGVY
jgi:hypothetical protein